MATVASEAGMRQGIKAQDAAPSDPQWYKDAVIYQLHIKAFLDSSGDGIGDFQGLIERLDYIEKLGATAIWLLPFYPSPLRDDGYDISDYRRINPAYGAMRDFRRFIREAHKRGLRVITELVINHTSDQHPWFQRARKAKPGSAARDFYVWSDSDTRYPGTRIIFLDTEASNWTWDPVAKAYFWHRFYSHQPDLNFDNPRVLDEVIKVMRYWLDMGVDGLRLDAIPYLVEREGTNNENLPETHDVLKKIRAALDARYDDRMLLAEANQWPEDTAPYFGDGDECHMAFHFPLMPRIYMAVAQEDRHPITDIIRQMPEIPESCQWAIFLRNHDELTLEMVTESERDYLWRTYAEDTRARINLGIRRRLAPLMKNDRRKIELMNVLLLSMPGTPILYYGDELGMGDNYYLGDRDGVRTPMQWTADRNGGFSRANPQQLYLPPVMDPVYGFQSINVEAQESDPSSLLNWMRQIVSVRAQSKAFSRGTIDFFYPANRKVLAYLRSHEDDRILCVVNLSRSPQAVELDLSEFRGFTPVELASRTPFPPIGDLPYLLTLPGHGYYWFQLEEEGEAPAWHAPLPEILPEFVTLTASGGTVESVLRGREKRYLESDVLPHFLPLQRWYGGKTDGPPSEVMVHPLTTIGGGNRCMAIADVKAGSSKAEYFLPLTISWGEENLRPGAPLLSHTLARVRKGPTVGALVDGAFDDEFALEFMREIKAGKPIDVHGGKLAFDRSDTLVKMDDPSSVRRMKAEQSNVSVIVDEKVMLKIYRRLQPGIQPDAEVGKFLSETAAFDGTPQYLGSAEFVSSSGDVTMLATAFQFVYSQGDAWTALLDALARDLENCRIDPETVAAPFDYPLSIGPILGRRTAELHEAFAAPTEDPAFAVESMRQRDLKSWVAAATKDAKRALGLVRKAAKSATEDGKKDLDALLSQKDRLLKLIQGAVDLDPSGGKSRIHGDYHLGQVLICQDDVMIVDFEGEPGRRLAERRTKSSPLRDAAGMLRSLDYLAWAALDRRREIAGRVEAIELERAMRWRDLAMREFLEAFQARSLEAPTYPSEPETAEGLLRVFTLQKAFYEIAYESANRPTWLSIPVRGILDLLKTDAPR